MNKKVVLLDAQLKVRGVAEKQRAHEGAGMLHLAFCVLIFNASGELLLQRRATTKYHFAGLWSNSCCGHPRPGEDVRAAAARRLREEFGFRTSLCRVVSFWYRARDHMSGMIEHEYAHVFIGRFSGKPKPDPLEIEAWRWQSISKLKDELTRAPAGFTPWFRRIASELFAAPYAKPHIAARFDAIGFKPRAAPLGAIVNNRLSANAGSGLARARFWR
jgi:isopentenyl-diphosphate delta-isomerase